MKFCIALLACLAASAFSFAQSIPENPNVTDVKGLRQGKWTLLFDANWSIVSEKEKTVYYRIIEYKDDKPFNVVRDYYRSGQLQWQGNLIVDRPKEIKDGEASWYRADGSKEVVRIFVNGKLEKETLFHADGSKVLEDWTTLNSMGLAAFQRGDFKVSMKLWESARAKAEQEFGPYHVKHALAMYSLAAVYKKMLRYKEAELLYNQAIVIIERIVGKEHVAYGLALNNLAVLYTETGSYNLAEPLYLESKNIVAKAEGKENLGYASAVNNLASLYRDMGNYDRAEQLFLESSDLRRKLVGLESEEYATALNNLGLLYHEIGQYDKAEQMFIEAKNIRKKVVGEKHMDYAASLNNLGSLCEDQQRYAEAKQFYEEAVSLASVILGTAHPDYALMLNNLGSLYDELGQYSKAEMLLIESRDIRDRNYGKAHPVYAASLSNLAFVYRNTGRFAEAELLFREAKKITEQALGRDHPQYAQVVNNLASLYYIMGAYKNAEILYNELIQLILKQTNRYFPALSESEKEQFYATVRHNFEFFNSFVFNNQKDNAALLVQAYNLQLATKGLLFNDSEKVRKAILKSKNDDLINMYNSWRLLRNKLVKVYQMSMNERKSREIDMDSLAEEINVREKELSRKSASFHSDANSGFVLDDVKKQLKKNEAAIEIVRFRKFGIGSVKTDSSGLSPVRYPFHSLVDTVCYATLIITRKSAVPDIVVIQNGNDLEGRFNKAYKNSIRFKLGDSISYTKFWGPIAYKLKAERIKRIYLSPDGVYNSINLNVLQNPVSGKFVADELDVQLVSNTKDLVVYRKDKIKNKKISDASLFGYPEYGAGKVDSIPGKNDRSFSAAYANMILKLFQGGVVSRLPGTEREVHSIAKLLTAQQVSNRQYVDNLASEEEIKALKNPQVVHIATHGFFMSDPDFQDEQVSKGVESRKFARNPLLRSGLLLANAKNTIDGKYSTDTTDDGVLTAYEAMNLNLDSTELVVLSACETGLGEIRNGEGVYGLQRAFQTAGAKSVLMSLWKVDDNATQELMTQFYKNWLQSGNKRKAFNEAQASIKAKYNHPYYWGAFVLVGE